MRTQTLALLAVAILMVAMLPGAFARPLGKDRPTVPLTTALQQTIRERARELKETPIIAARLKNLTRVGKLITSQVPPAAEDIRSYMREKFQGAIDKCRELNLSPERCEEKLQTRVQLVDKLSAQDLDRLGRIEAKKLEITNRLTQLREAKNFKHLRLVNKTIRGREIARAKIEAARERFENAKDRYNAAKNNLTRARDNFVQTRQRLQECPDNETECEQFRGQIKEHSRDYLANFLEMALKQLEKVRSRIESAEDLSEEDAADLLARVDSKMAEVQDLLDSVSNVTNETSKEDVLEIIREVKNIWRQEVKVELQRAAGFMQANRMGGVYVKMQHLEKRLGDVLAKMAEQGKDTSAAEAAIETFNTKIQEARGHYEQAIEKFKEAATLRGKERGAAVREAQSHMRMTKDSLKEAHNALKDVIKALRAQTVTDEDLEEEEAEEVLETEEEEIAEEEPEEPEENVTTPGDNTTAPEVNATGAE